MTTSRREQWRGQKWTRAIFARSPNDLCFLVFAFFALQGGLDGRQKVTAGI